MAESYTVNGTDLTTYLTHLQTLDGFIGVPQMRQDDFVIPGRTGSVAAAPWIGPRPLTVGGVVSGADRAAYQANLRALSSLCFNDGQPVTLGRTLAGSSAVAVEGEARYVGGLDSISQLSDKAGRVAVEFSLLTGVWLDTAETDSGPKTGPVLTGFGIQIPGDVTTSAVRVVFSGVNATQRLTNTTTGDWVQTTANTTTDAVTLDVSNFTAVQLVSSVISTVSSNTESFYWMRLAPGPNTFILTGGGTVRLYWKSAWL
jgi:hypothetical protein